MRLRGTNLSSKPGFKAIVDPNDRPAVVTSTAGSKASLDWDRALDDEGFLRRCVLCGGALYATRNIPRLTYPIVAAGAVVVALLASRSSMLWLAILAFLGLCLAEVLRRRFAPQSLHCYRCECQYDQLPIRPGHPRWDRALAESERSHAKSQKEST